MEFVPARTAMSSMPQMLRIGAAPRSDVGGWLVVALLLVFAAAQLAVRGPLDVSGNFNLCDFANHYSAARMWLIGGNPYDNAALPVAWRASGPGAVHTSSEQWYGLLPPGALVLLSSLAALPAGIAIVLWLVLSVGCVWACLACVMSLAQISARSLKGVLLISGALAAAPFQTLVAVGQASLPVVTMLLLALWCFRAGRDSWAGMLIGAAAAIKPQLAVPFAIFYLVYRKWKLVGLAAVICVVLNIIGVAQLEWRGVDWWSGWTANITASTSVGRANDPSLGAALRHQMIHLDVLIVPLLADTWTRTGTIVLILGVMVAAYIWLVCRGRQSSDSLLVLSILAAITLLPVYHRAYDAATLLLAYAWALSSLRGSLRRWAWITLGALSILLIPFDLLILLEQKAGLFRNVSQTWLWQAIITPHHAWAALLVCLCLLGALYARVHQLTASWSGAAARDILSLEVQKRALDTMMRWCETRKTG